MKNCVTFVGHPNGEWHVTSISSVRGETLPHVDAIRVVQGGADSAAGDAGWALTGLVSNVRYATRGELRALAAVQPLLGREEATCAALIPIRKSAQWWELAQDERRALLEDTSRHVAIGLEYLPRIARRLLHSRDLGEPFDFLTWFEFAPEHEPAFDELVAKLRATAEWQFVEREVDIRMRRPGELPASASAR